MPIQKIIIVEDDIVDFMLLAEAACSLGKGGRLIHTTSAQETLAALQVVASEGLSTQDVALIVDLNLKGETGFDVIRQIKIKDPDQQIGTFVWSSSADDEDQQTAQDLGVKAYFVKSSTQAENRAFLETVFAG